MNPSRSDHGNGGQLSRKETGPCSTAHTKDASRNGSPVAAVLAAWHAATAHTRTWNARPAGLSSVLAGRLGVRSSWNITRVTPVYEAVVPVTADLIPVPHLPGLSSVRAASWPSGSHRCDLPHLPTPPAIATLTSRPARTGV